MLIVFPLVLLTRNYLVGSSLLTSAAVAAIFAAPLNFLHPVDARMSQLSILKPLRFCGLMCYSLYLTHWTIVKFLSGVLAMRGVNDAYLTVFVIIPLCVAASVAVACGFHLSVEKRFMSRTAATLRPPPVL